jgi:FtsP/CotA-like multicopper oxidase with cupredoxin domain
MPLLTRRTLLQLAGLTSASGGLVAAQPAASGTASYDIARHAGHSMGPVGRVTDGACDPTAFLRTWNFSDLPPAERARYYREERRPDGTRLREFQIVAVDREIEIAPGVYFPAWTFNGRVPGPTLRATEGDRVRVTFLNQGWHPPDMDGSLPDQAVMPGDRFVYEFDADPFGLHLYHCHASPLKRHLHKGLYGVFIVDPRHAARQPADELVMVMNGFDTNFDSDNEVYAVNTVANHYMHEPVRVDVGALVRIYLVNVTEFDLLNSFHLHGMFFETFPTGTSLTAAARTDTIKLCQGERAILETRFRYPGTFMFHAHQSEFAELGWMGAFEAREPRRDT